MINTINKPVSTKLINKSNSCLFKFNTTGIRHDRLYELTPTFIYLQSLVNSR